MKINTICCAAVTFVLFIYCYTCRFRRIRSDFYSEVILQKRKENEVAKVAATSNTVMIFICFGIYTADVAQSDFDLDFNNPDKRSQMRTAKVAATTQKPVILKNFRPLQSDSSRWNIIKSSIGTKPRTHITKSEDKTSVILYYKGFKKV